MLNNSPLYVYSAFYLSTDGYLGCLATHVLEELKALCEPDKKCLSWLGLARGLPFCVSCPIWIIKLHVDSIISSLLWIIETLGAQSMK